MTVKIIKPRPPLSLIRSDKRLKLSGGPSLRGLPGAAGLLTWISGGWTTATNYVPNDGLERNGSSYRCKNIHTSGALTEPGVGANWTTVWDLVAAKGTNGVSIGIIWTYSTTTADADPGPGTFRLNNATPSSATLAYIDDLDDAGASAAAWLDTLDDSTNTAHRGVLVLRGLTNPSHWAVYNVTGTVVNGTGYRKVTLAHVASNLTGLAAGDRFVFDFSRTGNLGGTGATGPAIGVNFTYSTTTADADPGSGVFRLNNATIASATAAYIDDLDASANAISTWLDTFDDSTNTVRGTLVIRGVTTQTAFAVFDVTGSVVNGTGYRKLTLTHRASGGVWTNAQTFAMMFFRAGDAGAGAVSSVNGFAGAVVLETKHVEPGVIQTIASAATLNLAASLAARYLVTGTTTITAITLGNNKQAILRFAAGLTLTHNATTLILPTGANILTEADDVAEIETDASGNIRVAEYLRKSGKPLANDFSNLREKLTANRTYYVATTGNNSNNGLAVGTPFLTIQKALDTVFGTLDLGGFNVFIQVADGTYNGANSVGSPQVGAGIVTVVGNTTTPANVIISTTSADCFLASGSAQYVVSGMELRTTTSGQCVHAVGAGTKIEIGSAIRFGACASSHMLAEISGLVTVAANYSIVGGAQVHMNSAAAGFINCTSRTITLTGTPAFSVVFALAEGTGTTIYAFSNTYSGSATGTRYISAWLAYIHTNGGGASYFPGNAAGSVNNSGLYR